jgi:outer membrane protein assembly complex protein YaeT
MQGRLVLVGGPPSSLQLRSVTLAYLVASTVCGWSATILKEEGWHSVLRLNWPERITNVRQFSLKSLLEAGFAVLLAASFTAVPAKAQTDSSFFGKRVARVEYSPAKQPIDNVDLKMDQLVKPGAVLRESDVAASIDRLFASGYYEDIQVDAEMSPEGVVIRYITRPKTFVGHIQIGGKLRRPPNSGQIYSVLQMSPGRPFREEMLSTAENNVTKLLRDNGLFEGSVKIDRSLDIDTEQVNITVRVKPGDRARYQTPIIHGDSKLPLNTIVRATGWKIRFIGRWRQMTAALTQSGLTGIQKKYQNQDRLTADVNLDSMDYDAATHRVTPTLTLNAGPKVTIKALEAKVSKGRLRKYVPVYQEGTVDRDLLTEGARNLRDYFQSKGYPDVDVTFRRQQTSPDQEVIEYFIAAGKKKKLVHLAIEGNTYFQDDTLRERMFLRESSLQFWHGRYSEGFRKKDEDSISNLYIANGFRDVKVTSFVTNNYRGKSNQIAVTFRINEGPQWTVAKLNVEGIQRADAEAVQSRISMGPGQPYSNINVATDRKAILTYYSLQGFSQATFQYSFAPAKEPHEVLLTYRIDEGPQQFVRDVLLMGLNRTRRDVVKKRIPIRSGDPLSLARLSEGQRQLYNLGIFSRIDAGIQDPDGHAIRKYVFYDFDEARRYNMNIGFGAEIAKFGPSSANSIGAPAGSTGFSPRLSFDISRINLRGTDHSATLRTLVSNLEQRAALTYSDPNLFGMERQTFSLTGLYDNARNVQTFSSRREEASMEVSRPLSKPSTLSLQLSYRRVSTSNVVIPSLLVPQLLQPVRIGMLSVNYVQDRRDNPADAHHGIFNTLNIGFASKYIGSQVTFLKTFGRNATYTQFGKFVLARQTTFGVLTPFNYPASLGATNAIPLPERFYGGGSTTDRGFGEMQAGPRDIGVPQPDGTYIQPTGFPVGGNAVLFNSVELRFPLFGENISGVIFEDAGNVFQNLKDISFRYHQKNIQDFNYMVQAPGIGIRYKTPIGPVRVDLAYALNSPSFKGFKGTYDQLLQCGGSNPPDFCTPVVQNTGHFQFFFSIGQTF